MEMLGWFEENDVWSSTDMEEQPAEEQEGQEGDARAQYDKLRSGTGRIELIKTCGYETIAHRSSARAAPIQAASSAATP